MHRLIAWLERRTGIESAVKSFLYEQIPASSGWHQILGSMAVFAFLVQVFTGILLAFNYAPTPGEAYNSLNYLMSEVTGGRLIHGLHHWGASMMIIVTVLHMMQVFLYGAYKAPREVTWMVGVILLLLTMTFGLTGYLLPWDNRAYWGTVVTTQIAAQAPLVGPYLQRLMGSDGGVGVVTFVRFYSMHVLLLPQITVLLIILHIYLVRKHGVAPAVRELGPPRRFYPVQVMKDTVAIFAGFVILFVLAVVADVPLERLADPTDISYIPRPEWYFLFLFESLNFFRGPLEVVGSVALPAFAVLLLFLVPLLDRRPMVQLCKRVFAGSLLFLFLVAWSGLTVGAVFGTRFPTARNVRTFEASYGRSASRDAPVNSAVDNWRRFLPAELAGLSYFRSQNCVACHSGTTASIGPDLTRTAAAHRTATWLMPHFRNPARMVPGSSMPPIQLTDAQLSALSAFIIVLTPQTQTVFSATPRYATAGAVVYQTNKCAICHRLHGVGGSVGPPLDLVGRRRDRVWLEKHFADPQSVSPGSSMPPYKLDLRTSAELCDYLLALK